MITEPSSQKVPEKEFAGLRLEQLQRIVTLGVGGFGRVELVCFFFFGFYFVRTVVSVVSEKSFLFEVHLHMAGVLNFNAFYTQAI